MRATIFPAVLTRLTSVAVLATVLFAGSTVAAVRVGTPGNDTLVGTKKADRMTGGGGDDTLKGLGGNDTYSFGDDFGTDTLVEKDGEGSDTVDFHAVTDGPVKIFLVPEAVSVDPASNGATGPNGEVHFAYEVNGQVVQSIVENAIGGQGDGDLIGGGAGKNVLQPGGGATDIFLDTGGANDGAGGGVDLPASDDVYKGFATNTGTDFIQDFGGNGDVLDLRPYSTGDVFVTAIDFDGMHNSTETLQIVTGLTGQIIIIGQFGDVSNITTDLNYHGHIETIRFADKSFSTASGLQSLAIASTEALSRKQAQLAQSAEGLAEQARVLLATNDPLDLHPHPDGAAPREAAHSDRRQASDKHHTRHPSRRRR